MSTTQEGPRRPPPGELATYRDGKLETGSNREVASSSLPKNEAASVELKTELQKAISPPRKEDKAPEGVSSKSDTPNIKNLEGKDAWLGKSETEFDKQMNTLQTRWDEIIKEASRLQWELKDLNEKVQKLEIEWKKHSEEAKKALDEIAKSASGDPQNKNIGDLKDLAKNLPDKLTVQDVEKFKERARMYAAQASVSDKDFDSMNQYEKAVVLERVKKTKENVISDPASVPWGDAKKTIGLSPNTKWADMTPAEQELVQTRVAESQKNPAASASAPNTKTTPPTAETTPVGPSKTADSTFPQPENTTQVTTQDQQTYSDFAKAHGTTIDWLNTNNWIDLKWDMMLAKESELYVPQPVEWKWTVSNMSSSTPSVPPVSEKLPNSSSYSFLKEGIKTENEAWWDRVSIGSRNVFIQWNQLIFNEALAYGPDTPWMNFEVTPQGELKYLWYNKKMYNEAAPTDETIRWFVEEMNKYGLNVTWNGKKSS